MATYPLIRAVDGTKWSDACASNVKLQQYIATLRPIIGDAYEEHKDVVYAAACIDDINTTFDKGETLLHWAASRQYYLACLDSSLTAVRLLLHLGANPNARDRLGRTPLHWVATYWNTSGGRNPAIPTDLLFFGASPDIPDVYGATPVCLARWANANELVEIFDPLTDPSLNNYPQFVLQNICSTRDVRRSKIANWIKDQAGDRLKNRERICQMLYTPGLGIVQHDEEEQQQTHQIFALLKRVSDEISRDTPVFAFRPYLAGSSAERTKRGSPDEKDIIIHLEHLSKNVVPERDADDTQKLVKLRLTKNASSIPKEYTSHGFLNRAALLRDFMVGFQRAMSLIELWNTDEHMNIYPGESVSCPAVSQVIDHAANEGDICTYDVIWCGEHYKHIEVSIDIVPAIVMLTSTGALEQRSKNVHVDIHHTMLAILKSKAETFDFVEDNETEIVNDVSLNGASCREPGIEMEFPAEKRRTFNMQSHVDDIVFSDSENDSDIDYDVESEENMQELDDELREIDEEIREDGRLYVRKEADIGETYFYVSFCAEEVRKIKSLPGNLRAAYILSKALVDFIPEIRTAANKGIHPNFNYYEGRKDISSYMVKMALLQAHIKYESRDKTYQSISRPECSSGVQVGLADSSQTTHIPDVDRQLSVAEVGCSRCQTSSLTACPNHDVPDVSQLEMSPSSCSRMHTSTSDNRCTPADVPSRIQDISLWVERIFVELEEAAETGHLPVFFDPKSNALDKLITLSEQKAFPYPGLVYLRAHCKMIRALVKI